MSEASGGRGVSRVRLDPGAVASGLSLAAQDPRDPRLCGRWEGAGAARRGVGAAAGKIFITRTV